MTLTLYRSDCYLFHADGWPIVSWSDWSFEPIQAAERECQSGNRKVRDCPLPFAVVTPPLAKLADGRLHESGDKFGLDAGSVWHLAARGERGFAMKQQSLFGDEKPAPFWDADKTVASLDDQKKFGEALEAAKKATPPPRSAPLPRDKEIEQLCLIITRAKMHLNRGEHGQALEVLSAEIELRA